MLLAEVGLEVVEWFEADVAPHHRQVRQGQSHAAKGPTFGEEPLCGLLFVIVSIQPYAAARFTHGLHALWPSEPPMAAMRN